MLSWDHIPELQSENSTLRNIVGSNERGGGGGGGGKSDLVDHVVFLERNLLEEQLLTSDLRKKLQTADKQNASLLLRMRREGRVGEGKDRRGSIPTHLSPLAAQDQVSLLPSHGHLSPSPSYTLTPSHTHTTSSHTPHPSHTTHPHTLTPSHTHTTSSHTPHPSHTTHPHTLTPSPLTKTPHPHIKCGPFSLPLFFR